jgi:hypothetical protein
MPMPPGLPISKAKAKTKKAARLKTGMVSTNYPQVDLIARWKVPFYDDSSGAQYNVPGYCIVFTNSTDGSYSNYVISTATNLFDWQVFTQGRDNRRTVEVWDFSGRPAAFWKFLNF